jgi:hypothetical protein
LASGGAPGLLGVLVWSALSERIGITSTAASANMATAGETAAALRRVERRVPTTMLANNITRDAARGHWKRCV